LISSIINSSVSGLRAAGLRLGTAAANIVNVNSTAGDGSGQAYQPKRVEQTSVSGGGVVARQVAIDPATLSVFAPDVSGADAHGNVSFANVSLATEAVELKQADIAYRANLKAIETADKMLGELIDDKT